MNTELETAVTNAAKIICETNPTYTPEMAQALAIQVMSAAGVDMNAPAKTPAKPAGPPPMPKYDNKTDVFAYGRELARWNEEIQTSYHPPINEVQEAARKRLVEMRTQSDNESDAVKVQRALEKERLIQIVYGGAQ